MLIPVLCLSKIRNTDDHSDDGVANSIERSATMMRISQPAPEFAIDAGLDPEQLCEAFREFRRLRILEFLDPSSAETLYQFINNEAEWNLIFVSNGRMYELPAEYRKNCSDQDEQRLVSLAHANAKEGGLGFIYDATRRIEPDQPPSTQNPSVLTRFANFVNSPPFLDFVRHLSGIAEINSADVQARRFRVGNFMTFCGGARGQDNASSRRAFYRYNLTPEWKAEWGGLLEFRGAADCSVDAYVPCFNCLDIFYFPQGHWVSAVSPFAGGDSFSIEGSLCANSWRT
jgi:Rps23 Pro-64 3,4-dihydroxylase Tpa1-like proline 4-hydroxylase